MTNSGIFYVKVKVDSELELIVDLKTSPDKSQVEGWTGTPSAPSETDNPADDAIDPLLFDGLTDDLLSFTDAFYKSIPVSLRLLPAAFRIDFDKAVKGFTKSDGVLIDQSGEFETYQLPIDLYGPLVKRLEDSVALFKAQHHFPAMFLMGLVSRYDDLIARLLRAIIITKPDIVDHSNRSITLKELIVLGSIEDAREQAIEAEIDEIMRKSHEDHVEWIEKRVELSIKDKNNIWGKYVEIFERRNLLTHTSGKVSPQYLAKCKAAWVRCFFGLAGVEVVCFGKLSTRGSCSAY